MEFKPHLQRSLEFTMTGMHTWRNSHRYLQSFKAMSNTGTWQLIRWYYAFTSLCFLPHMKYSHKPSQWHPSVAASPCVGRPWCGQPTSLSPSGSTIPSPFSDWPQTAPFARERAASGWGFAGGGRGPRTPSLPAEMEGKQGGYPVGIHQQFSIPGWQNCLALVSPCLYVSVLCHLHVSRSAVGQQEEPPLSHGDLPHAAARLDGGGELEDALTGLNALQDGPWQAHLKIKKKRVSWLY